MREREEEIKSHLEILCVGDWSHVLSQATDLGFGGLHFLICKPVKIILALHLPLHFWDF